MFEGLFGKKSYNNIDQRVAKERLDTDQNVVLIDVRTPEEYTQAHIPKSVSLPLNQLKTGITKITNDKEKELFVYCLSGGRAASACSQLAAMGYQNVSNMGGIQTWKYQTVSGRK